MERVSFGHLVQYHPRVMRRLAGYVPVASYTLTPRRSQTEGDGTFDLHKLTASPFLQLLIILPSMHKLRQHMLLAKRQAVVTTPHNPQSLTTISSQVRHVRPCCHSRSMLCCIHVCHVACMLCFEIIRGQDLVAAWCERVTAETQ